jgi:hypothetical protein
MSLGSNTSSFSRVFRHGGIITAGAEVGLAEAVAILVECGATRGETITELTEGTEGDNQLEGQGA